MRPSGVLAERDFRLVLAAWGLSALGDFLAVVALTLRIQEETGSGLAVAALLVAAALPLVVFNPLAGWLVDRRETRTVLAAVAALQVLVCAGLAAAPAPGATIALVFALNCGLAVERPALFALIPRIVGEEAAPSAYAWFEGVKYATFTLGMLLGGVLTGALGAGSALLVDAATFACTAMAALALRVRRAPAGREVPGGGGGLAAGLRLVAGERLLRALTIVLTASVVFGGIDNVAMVFFAKDGLGVGDAGFGALSAAWGAGMVAGATLAGRRVAAATAPAAVLAAVVAMGAGIGATGAAPVLAPALAFLVIGGAGNGLANVGMRVVLQSRVPDALRGRVYSAYQAALTVSDFAAMAAGGALVELAGPRATLGVAGAGCVAVTLAGVPAVVRSRGRR